MMPDLDSQWDDSGGDRGEVHRQQEARLGKLIDPDHCTGGPVAAHHGDVGAIHLVKIAHVFQEDVDVDDAIEVRADRVKHHAKRLENAGGL